jgi:tetratricopeptide (TPR) repeat protein
LSSFNNNTTYGQVQVEETVDVVENDVKELVSRGNSLYDLRNYPGAIEYYDKALAIDPNNIDDLNGKGSALSNFDQYEEAIQHYDKALTNKSK